jgi:vancomycin resistance protein YoaR
MKSKSILIIIISTLIIGGIVYYLYNTNKNQKSQNFSSYNSSKTSINETLQNTQNTENNSITENKTDENTTANEISENSNNNSANTEQPKSQDTPQTETEIASFSTKIYSKDSERQNNVSITCSKLNDTIVESGKTFSFCDTVGKATSSKGYQKADVFRDGEKIKALGGGNCQVSTTLYNAVLKIPELKVTERHAHSNSVPYIEEGKDAAVSYGAYDLKFINNTRKLYQNKM